MIADLWRSFLWLLRALWACRVGVVSGVAGLALFSELVQAQNLLADTSWNRSWGLAVLYWAGFFAAVFLIWAFPIHYGSRTILDDERWVLTARVRATMGETRAHHFCAKALEQHPWLILLLPRFLGMAPFAAVAIGLWHASDMPTTGTRNLPEAAAAVTLTHVLQVANAFTAAAFLLFVIYRRPWLRRLTGRHADGAGPARPHGIDWLAVLAAACTWLTFACFVLADCFPVWLAAYVPRALMVPFLLGSLVLPLSALARRSHAHGIPYLFLLGSLCLGLTALNRGFHDLRTVPAAPTASSPRQIDIAAAALRWKLANGCGPDSGKACPTALIVAAEGGASRAAFMLATAVGALLDRAADLKDDASLTSPGRRIFAISGVSGGAFGAAVIHAALADAAASGGGSQPPCRSAPGTWFRAGDAAAHPDLVRSNWRYCLQALTSGDYLSPAFVGLAFRDVLAPHLPWVGPDWQIEDRAALLEQAWDRHYDWVVHADASSWSSGEPCTNVGDSGLCRRFGYAASLAGEGAWVPLLLLNGTSVATGRRIVVSDISRTPRQPAADCGPLYAQAYDLFEVMGNAGVPLDAKDRPTPAEPACRTVDAAPGAPDIRLSTAALASARFPVISPAGRVHPANHDDYGDRLVDGGYFENAGVTTAADLARALADGLAKGAGIHSIVLWVANEPILATEKTVVPDPPGQPPRIGPADDTGLLTRAFALLFAPATTLYNTRNGHGAEAAEFVRQAGLDVHRIRVFAEAVPKRGADKRCNDLKGPFGMATLSMSWWLSPAVQADLDAQLCDERNQAELDGVMKVLAARP